MVQKVQKVEKQHAKIGNNLGLLLFVLTVMSQHLLAQKPVVALTVDQKTIAPKDRITITVTSNVEGSMSVDYPLEFDVDYGVMHGMEQKMDPSGKLKTFYYMQQSGSFRKEGTYSFYAHVSYKGKTCKSNKLTITVTNKAQDDDATISSNDPVFGIIQAKKNVVYEGEPVLVKAKVFSRLGIVRMEGYSPFEPDRNAEQHAFPNQREYVEETKLNGKPALTFEIGKQLLIPVATGKCKIQPFEMALRCEGSLFSRTVRFRSSSLTLLVKPLPSGAPKDFIGAVGKFDVSQHLGNTHVKQGDVFTLKLMISGIGNLHNINTPELNLPDGCNVYGEAEREDDVQFTEDGVTGTVTFLYNIQLSKAGEMAFLGPSISYFDPNKEQYVTIRTEAFTLHVAPDKSYQPLASSDPVKTSGHSDKVAKNASAKETASQNKSSVGLLIGIVTPISALGLLLLFLFLRKKRSQEPYSVHAERVEEHKNCVMNTFGSPETIDFWSEATSSLEDKNKFSIVLPKAIVQQLEKRYGCTFMSRDRAFDQLHSVHSEVSDRLKEIINQCDHFRYGFGVEEIHTEDLLIETKDLLDQIA